MKDHFSIAVAGSTTRTESCIRAIATNKKVKIDWVLTPVPRPVGRKQILTTNPVEQYAVEHSIPVVSVETKIDTKVQMKILDQVQKLGKPDILLVVDFGYLVPEWLLELPTVAPLNIHPSLLPRWRGSSPGQFCLLAGESESAVTLMVMNSGLDEGPIIAQLPFTVGSHWTQVEYYQHSFELMCGQLAELIFQFANGQVTAYNQPSISPTPVARRLSKEDSFVSWSIISKAINDELISPNELNPCLAEVYQYVSSQQPAFTISQLIEHACRAFSPWPQLWTRVQTSDGEKRMKIISCHLHNQRLVLDTVQLEGRSETTWQICQQHIHFD